MAPERQLSLTGFSQSGPQIDTTTPAVTALTESPTTGDLGVGKTVTLTLKLNEAVTVSGGTPTLTLNDGGVATYIERFGHKHADFHLYGRRGQIRTSLRSCATAVNLNGATVVNGAGTTASLSLTGVLAERPADRHHDAGR